jgi:outer membrane immunogenic protein
MRNALKRFGLGVAGLLALSVMAVPAFAADLRVKAPPPAPVVAPIYNWTGFYIGANGGWAQVENCWENTLIAGGLFDDGCSNRSGGTIGGQIGYRWQSNQFVFGLEAQGNWADLTSTRVSLFDPLFSTRVSTDAIGLFTGQIGWAWDAVLLYVKGGAAVTNTDFGILTTLGEVELASASATRWGATVGAGLEWGFAPNWSVGVEYNHLFMGDTDHSFVVPALAVASSRIDQDIDMVTLRLNYRFGWGGTPGRF